MSTRSFRIPAALPPRRRPAPELVQRQPRPVGVATVRAAFWAVGVVLAGVQAWAFRYYVSADAISYLDMSDGVMPGGSWHRLINGVWSPLYPLLLGIFRRTFNITAANEIAAGHLLNLGFFLFAFLCFELLLRKVVRRIPSGASLPAWAISCLAYSLFLWASISKISLTSLRADMLMSGFVYLAAGILLTMQGRQARWREYCNLGLVLGIGTLAKSPILPLGIFVVAVTLFAVQNWRSALKMAAGSLLIFLAIGSLYFAPVSIARGHFTFGESATFNYLAYVNRARPMWYMQEPGSASGHFSHSPEKIFSTPTAYAFGHSSLVTHPLRFDPSDWVRGVRPRFVLRDQVRGCIASIRKLIGLLAGLSPVVLLALTLVVVSSKRRRLSTSLKSAWPVWLVGFAGCVMYVPMHVEPRYVGAFLALFWLGLILSFDLPGILGRRLANASTIVVVAGLIVPLIVGEGMRYLESRRIPNNDANAAVELAHLGIKPGNKVARISPTVTDLGIERIARVEVVAEVGIGDSARFWSSSRDTQDAILNLLASRGARAVIATLTGPVPKIGPEWTQLGFTQYWAWIPKSSQ